MPPSVLQTHQPAKPAFDLTYSSTAFGGHTTTVMGKGNPSMQDVLLLAEEAGMPSKRAATIAADIAEACAELLSKHAVR